MKNLEKLFLLVLLVGLMLSTAAWGQTTIVNYDFNSGGSDAALTPALASGITSTFSCTQGWQTYTGTASGGQAFTSNSTAGNSRGMALSSGTDTKWYTFVMGGSNLPNYKTFNLYFQAQRSASGAQTFTVKYSKDGGAFTAFTNNTMAPGNGSFTEGLFNLPLGADNPTTSLEIRISVSGASGTGTCRIDNIEVQATLSATPTLMGTPSTLNSFSYGVGTGPSVSQSYSLSGLNLTGAPGNINVSGSASYEVSLDNSTFNASVLVPYSSSTLSATPIYVRLKAGLSAGYYNSEVISNAGGGASTVNTNCNGYVLGPPTTYSWIGVNPGDWTTSTNWSPSRTTPAANDIIQFTDGASHTVSNVPTELIGQLLVSGGTYVTLQTGAGNTLSLIGASGTDLSVGVNDSLNINGTNALAINLVTGTTGSISGKMIFSGSGHKLTATDVSSITFQNGATFETGTGFSGNSFGVGTANSIIFSSGSFYIYNAGSNPFGLTAPSSVVVWQAGSTYRHQATGDPSLANRTYANFEFRSNVTNSHTSSSPVTVDSLIISGTSSVSLGVKANFNIKGNISIDNGATLNLNPSTPGTIIFSGPSQQYIWGAGTLTTNSSQAFQLDNAAGIVLSKDLAILGNLTLTNGKVMLGSNILSLTGTLTGGTSSNYVVATGSGEFRKVFTAAASFTYPIGDASNYSPVTLTFTGGAYTSAYAGIKLMNAKHPNNYSANDYLKRYWTVSSSGISGFSCDVTCEYVSADVNGTESNITGGKLDAGVWTYFVGVDNLNHRFTATGCTSFSDFSGGENGAMPVQLASFVGSYVGNNAILEWSTISEVNNYGFNVQRLNEATKNFETISFIAGKGTTLEPQSYSFVDNQPGTSYRLEQIDNNGLKNYFGPIYLNPNSVDDKSVPAVFALNQNYPNPFNPTTNLTFSLANSGHTTLKVYNILGNEVATLFNGNGEAGKLYNVKFDASKLTTGMYIYKLQNGNSVEVRKLTLVK
jgi:hypothetical protein